MSIFLYIPPDKMLITCWVGVSTALPLWFWWNAAMLFCPCLKLPAAPAKLVVDVSRPNALCLPETHMLLSCLHVIISHQQISHPKCLCRLRFVRTWARWCFCNRLWFAPCALKHNGTFARIVSIFPIIFLLHVRADMRRGATIFGLFKYVSPLGDHSGARLLCRGHCHLVDRNMYQH